MQLSYAQEFQEKVKYTPERIRELVEADFALHTDLHFSELPEWGVANGVPLFERFYEDWQGRVKANPDDPNCPGVGIITAHAVCTHLRNEGSLMDILRKIIEQGGDTDSVAAIAWGIASARYQGETLPEFLEHCLEKGGKYGPEYLKGLGRQLMDEFSHTEHQ